MATHFDYKRTFRRWQFSPITLALMLVVVIYALHGVYQVYQKERLSNEYLTRTQNDLKRVSDREAALNDSVKYLKTSEGIEAELRTKFRVVKDGEEVAVIVNSNATSSLNMNTSQGANSVGFWGTIKSWFSF